MSEGVWRRRATFAEIHPRCAPALLACQGDADAAAERGCILVLHGLGASKDVHVKELDSLAGRGFLAVGLDSVGHGERRHPDFERRFSQDNPEFYKNFLQAVVETAGEVPLLLDALTRAGFVKPDRVGILSISMGGFVTYKAVTLEPRLGAAVAVVASPEWPLELPGSPHRQPERFDRVRLLSQTAGRDAVVPSRYARAFHARLRERYRDYDARFAYTEYPESDHLLERDWGRLWARTLEWFGAHLGEG